MKYNQIPMVMKLYSIAMFEAEDIHQEIKELNLEKNHFLYLFFIYYKPGINQEKISAYFGADKSTVTRNLRKLELRGLVKRQKDPENRRSNNIFLTDKGSIYSEKILNEILEWQDELLKNVKETDKIEQNINDMFSHLFLKKRGVK